MKNLTLLMTLSLLFIIGCSSEEILNFDEEIQTFESSRDLVNSKYSKGKIIHHVSVGSNDFCSYYGLKSGCDANFSLVANMHADGSISGQWSDMWVTGSSKGDGVHIEINCMKVTDNWAIIGGIVTKGSDNGYDLTGHYAYTIVRDNGTSKKDTPDQISYAFTETLWGGVSSCEEASNININDFIENNLLFDIKGQVKVW